MGAPNSSSGSGGGVVASGGGTTAELEAATAAVSAAVGVSAIVDVPRPPVHPARTVLSATAASGSPRNLIDHFMRTPYCIVRAAHPTEAPRHGNVSVIGGVWRFEIRNLPSYPLHKPSPPGRSGRRENTKLPFKTKSRI
jgi:hypothetical protein